MSQLSASLHQSVGDPISVVPCGDDLLITLGRRTGGGMITAVLPQAQAAVLLSKLTTAFMTMEAPTGWRLPSDAGLTQVGAASQGVLAGLRANLEKRGAVLTTQDGAPDDLGPREDGEPDIAAILRALEEGASADEVRQRWNLGPIGESSLGSPSLSTALSNLGPGATRDQIRVALGWQPMSDGQATIADVEDYLGRVRHEGNVVHLRAPRP